MKSLALAALFLATSIPALASNDQIRGYEPFGGSGLVIPVLSKADRFCAQFRNDQKKCEDAGCYFSEVPNGRGGTKTWCSSGV